MYETLCLHSALGMNLSRDVSEGDIEIDGHCLAGGTVIGPNP